MSQLNLALLLIGALTLLSSLLAGLMRARLTLAVAVMSAALRLPRRYVRGHARALAALLGLGMWAVSGLLVWGLLGLPFWVAFLVGAAVTPTDPVLAGGIVTGGLAERDVPARLRHLLTAESGARCSSSSAKSRSPQGAILKAAPRRPKTTNVPSASARKPGSPGRLRAPHRPGRAAGAEGMVTARRYPGQSLFVR